MAAARLIDVERLRYIARASRYDAVLLVATTLAALIIGVEFAILIGIAVSLLLLAPRAAKLRFTELVVSDERIVRERLPGDQECSAVRIYDLEGDLFFGAAPTFEACLDEARDWAKSPRLRRGRRGVFGDAEGGAQGVCAPRGGEHLRALFGASAGPQRTACCVLLGIGVRGALPASLARCWSAFSPASAPG